uniref:Protein krueppel n=1 Tax=Anopheles minimus TaxID=112268 RepID=A0A182W7H6_9DIPT
MNQNILCRVCASTDTDLDLVNIFDDYETEERIADILLVDVKSDDESTICSKHEQIPKYHCSECSIDFYSSKLLKKHYQSNHANGHSALSSAIDVHKTCIKTEIFFQSTEDCDFPPLDVESDDVSMTSSKHEQTPKYHCSECSIDFYTSELLQEHYQSNHANAIHGWKSFGISEISLFDTTDDEEEETVQKIPQETPVKLSHRCCGCALVFDTVAELEQHSKTVHATNAVAISERKPYQCEMCFNTYTTQRGVIDHQIKRTNLMYQCLFCGILFGNKFDLRFHEYRHVNHTFPCNICGRKFFKLTNLNRHKESMHIEPDLRHFCNICGAGVRSANYLKLHMRLHSKEEPYSCNLCGARFKLSRYLSWHMAVHKGAHRCDECDLSFKSASELQDHMYCHIGLKNFDCSLCSSRFCTKKNRQKHMRTPLHPTPPFEENDLPVVRILAGGWSTSRERAVSLPSHSTVIGVTGGNCISS